MPDILTDISIEHTAVVRAQQAVDRWARSRSTAPFPAFLQRVIDQSTDSLSAIPAYKRAVQRVAESIHSGRGHAFRDREVLLAIARNELDAPE